MGAGLIVKDIYKDVDGITHTVKGLNTAASVWLSAAVGIACGGGLYFVATYTSALMLVLLRFGPRNLVPQESILGSLVLPDRHPPNESIQLLSSGQGRPNRKTATKPSLNYD